MVTAVTEVAPSRPAVGTRADDNGVDLVRAAQLEPAAFGSLYSRYVTRIYRFVRLRVAREQDALDLTQQIFLQALDGLPRYRPTNAPFSAWLFRIARNAVSDHHRRRKVSVPWGLVPQSLHPASEDEPELAMLRDKSLDELRSLVEARTCTGGTFWRCDSRAS